VRLLRDKWELRKIQNYTKLLNSDDFSVLDVGCGTGRLLSLIREAHPNSKLQGIELDSRAVKIARGKGLIVERTTIEKYAPKKKFNLIIMQQVIEHVANPIAIMNKLKSLLVPDGVLILETPNLSGWDYKVFKKELWGGYHFPRHWVLFSRRSLRTLSEKTGFRVLAQENIASLSFWSWSIHHWLKKKKHTGMAQWVRPPNALLLSITAPLELVQLLCGLQTSNQRVVLQKK
jgi:2-polyprenyl-3-methyl-5-hydroxy-6-metoxy-1,4-benzoquinol methylase